MASPIFFVFTPFWTKSVVKSVVKNIKNKKKFSINQNKSKEIENCMINLKIKKMTGIDHPAQCRCDLIKSRQVLINESYKPDANLHSSLLNYAHDITF